MDWILHDTPNRRRHVFDLLASVRFPIISNMQLEKYIEDCQDLSLKIAVRKLAQDFRRDRRASFEMRLKRVKPNMMKPRKVQYTVIWIIWYEIYQKFYFLVNISCNEYTGPFSGGSRISQTGRRGVQSITWHNFCRKLHKNERFWPGVVSLAKRKKGKLGKRMKSLENPKSDVGGCRHPN